MRRKIIGIFVLILMITTILPLSATSEKSEKTLNENGTGFVFKFGFVTIDAIIKEKESFGTETIYYCQPVEKVTVIGFGTYYNSGSPERDYRFYMETFTNVHSLGFSSTKNFDVSDEYQHFSLLSTLRNNYCGFIFE